MDKIIISEIPSGIWNFHPYFSLPIDRTNKTERTFSVAPGNKFRRFFFPSLWSDPKLEDWDERLDRICWIGRPLPERIRLAKKINEMGIELDIYSKDPWPLPNWKGFAENEIMTSMGYKYRIVYENSMKNLYHSEKFFNSIRSGCVSFYIADPELKLPHLAEAYVNCTDYTLINREEIASDVLNDIQKVMFTDLWEIYSFNHFFDTIIHQIN